MAGNGAAENGSKDSTPQQQSSPMSPRQTTSTTVIHDGHHDSPLLFDALFEKNFSLAAALIAENRGLHYISAIHSNNSVLHIAVLNDAPLSLIKELIDRGLDANQRNHMGRSPVYLAARHNCRVATLKYLVTECGGVLNCVDNYEYTPLMSAAYNGASLEMIRTLIELGADVHARDSMGNVATHWAREGNHPEIIEYLEKVMAAGTSNGDATSQNADSPKTHEIKSVAQEKAEGTPSSKRLKSSEETERVSGKVEAKPE